MLASCYNYVLRVLVFEQPYKIYNKVLWHNRTWLWFKMDLPYNRIASGVSEEDFKAFLEAFIYLLSWLQFYRPKNDTLYYFLEVKYFFSMYFHLYDKTRVLFHISNIHGKPCYNLNYFSHLWVTGSVWLCF